MKPCLPFLILAGVAAGGLVPASAADAASKPIKAKYDCKGGKPLSVVFQGSKATVTPKGGKAIVLKQGLAADGFLYASSKYSLRGRGDDATWTTGKGKPLQCHARS